MTDDVRPDGGTEPDDGTDSQDGADPDTPLRSGRADTEPSRFVVPDPADPPEGVPTTFIPPTYHGAPPTATHPPTVDQHWSAPGEPAAPPPPPGDHQPYPTTQQPTASGYPQSPPTAPPQQWGPSAGSAAPVGGWDAAQQPGHPAPSQYPQTQYPQTQYAQYPPPPQQEAGKAGGSGRAVAIVVGALILLLVAVGGFFAFRAVTDSAAPFEGTVDECHIASDGTLTASGTITSDEAVDTTLEVRFEDVTDNAEVDRSTVDVSGSAGEQIPWSVTGHAPDDVTRVTCSMGPAD